jgi:hypothetical protein
MGLNRSACIWMLGPSEEFSCLLTFSVVGTTGRSFYACRCPVIGGRYLQIGLLGHVVSSNEAVVGLEHGFFVILLWQLEGCPRMVEISESYPHDFVFVLEGLIGEGFKIVEVTFG